MLDAMMDLGRRKVTMCETVDVLAKEAPDIYREIKHSCTSLLLLPLLFITTELLPAAAAATPHQQRQ